MSPRACVALVVLATLGAGEPDPAPTLYACPEHAFVAGMTLDLAFEHEFLGINPRATLLIGTLASRRTVPWGWRRVEDGEPRWRPTTVPVVQDCTPAGEAGPLVDWVSRMGPPLPGRPVHLVWISSPHHATDREVIAHVCRRPAGTIDVCIEATRVDLSRRRRGPPDRRSLRVWRLPALPPGDHRVEVVRLGYRATDPGRAQRWEAWPFGRFVGGRGELTLPATAPVAIAGDVERRGLEDRVGDASWLPPRALRIRLSGALLPPRRIRDAAGALVPPAEDLPVVPGLWGYGRFCDLPKAETLAGRFAADGEAGRLPTFCQAHETRALQDAGVAIACMVPRPVALAQVLCPELRCREAATVRTVTAMPGRQWSIGVELWLDDGPRDRDAPWSPLFLVPLPELPAEIVGEGKDPATATSARVGVGFRFLRAEGPGGWYRPVDPPEGRSDAMRLAETAAVP